MKPVIALIATLVAAGGLAAQAHAQGADRYPRGGGQQHGWHDSRPDGRGYDHGYGHGYGHDQWRGHYGQGWYAPRSGYAYPHYYGYWPRYSYPPAYRYPPRYRHYYRGYGHDYDDDDYDYYYNDYRGFDDGGISLIISVPLRF